MNNIWKQIQLAKKEFKIQKKCSPYLFAEYLYMMDCKVIKEIAERDYLLAKEVWDKLGK